MCLVRTALALSTLTDRPFRAERIRQNRPAAGLQAQHLSAIQALVRMSGARVEGAAIGTGEIGFWPNPIKPGADSLDIGTAGSVTLFVYEQNTPWKSSNQMRRCLILKDGLPKDTTSD
jgi:RNA 3'-terminal phosphate cyclase (ATP)